jgi:hypothetical protein
MSRQFRSDDSSVWADKYGNGQAGATSISGTYGAGTGGYVGACSGTSGTTSLTTPNGWGVAYGGWPCLIWQTQSTSNAGVYEFNFITTIVGTTSTLRYTLQNTYSTGAQCILAVPYTNLTISGTLTAPAWDTSSSTGGGIFLLCNGTFTNNSTITAAEKGFIGGRSDHYRGEAGESYYQTRIGGYQGGSPWSEGSANYNGGGGGPGNNSDNAFKPNGGGGGGGHATGGGTGNLPGDQTYPGYGGGTCGVAGLTTLFMGGGGGGAATPNYNGYWVPDADYMAGERGGGLVVIMARTFVNNGTISVNGESSTTRVDAGRMGYGGAGAAGSILIKSIIPTLGTLTANGGGTGAAGGNGRIHVDYLTSYSITSGSPTPDYRQDFGLRVGTNRGAIII